MKYPIVILGGYGTTGTIISRLFLENTSYNIIIAGRNPQKGTALCKVLNEHYTTERAIFKNVDCKDSEGLVELFRDRKLIINASSASEYTESILNATTRMRSDIMDIQYSNFKNSILLENKEKILNSGIRWLTDAGFHPGLPSAMIRYIGSKYTSLESANVFSILKVDWKSLDLSQSTIDEFFKELLSFQPLSYREGEWRDDISFTKTFEFTSELGKQSCYPMYFEELKSIPELYPTLKETGFFIGGFNPIVDNVLLVPVYIFAKMIGKISYKILEKIFYYGLREFTSPPYYTEIALEADGIDGDLRIRRTMSLSHESAYYLTAVPAFASALQLLDGTIKEKGLLYQGLCVDTEKFFTTISSLHIKMELRQK